MSILLVAAGGVALGWLARDVRRLTHRHRLQLEPYPQRIHEPLSHVWIDDDTQGLTVD